MCVTIKEICPWCKIFTGNFTTLSCRARQCDQNETVHRVLRISHLKDWSCTTNDCEYNQQQQEKQDRTIRDILASQYKKSGESSYSLSEGFLDCLRLCHIELSPFTNTLLFAGNGTVRESIEKHQINVELDSSESDLMIMDSEPGPPRLPTPPRRAPSLAPALAAALATAPPTPLGLDPLEFLFGRPGGGRDRPGPLPPVPELDLSKFSPADGTKITRLLMLITPRMHGTTGCDWLPEEDELLNLLSDVYQMPPSRISAVSLTPSQRPPLLPGACPSNSLWWSGQFALMCRLCLVPCRNFCPIARPAAAVPAGPI